VDGELDKEEIDGELPEKRFSNSRGSTKKKYLFWREPMDEC